MIVEVPTVNTVGIWLDGLYPRSMGYLRGLDRLRGMDLSTFSRRESAKYAELIDDIVWKGRDIEAIYYRGLVRELPGRSGYEYVTVRDVGALSNYKYGGQCCAEFLSILKSNELMLGWWEEYEWHGSPVPNCWRRQADNPECVAGSVPLEVKEVALYDLLLW